MNRNVLFNSKMAIAGFCILEDRFSIQDSPEKTGLLGLQST
ncbi:hypothetical protein [Nostoc sp.]